MERFDDVETANTTLTPGVARALRTLPTFRVSARQDDTPCSQPGGKRTRMIDNIDPDAWKAFKADLLAHHAEIKAADAARREAARARGEALYPDPGFKASRLIEPAAFGDFGYHSDVDLRSQRRNRSAADSPEDAARERAAMAALKARRGCPAWVAPDYVDALRRQGGWWNDIPL